MRTLKPILASTLILGSLGFIGCAEHRYSSGPAPYYGGGYYGDDYAYRQWLAERHYNYVEYNRLNNERQREYWEWRRANDARLRNDARFRNNPAVVRNDHDADDRRRNTRDADDRRGRDNASVRDGDRDRHQSDKDRHQVRDRDHDKGRDKDRDKDKDKDHDKDRR